MNPIDWQTIDWQTIDWQTIAALTIVAWAGMTLLRMLFFKKASPGGCGSGCQNCPSNRQAANATPHVVTISTIGSKR